MRKWLFAIVATLFLVGTVACSNESKTESLTKVRVAEVTHSLFYAPLYVAIEKGLFKDQGLDVELTTTWGGDKTMATLLSDGADIGLIGSETSVYVYNQKAKDPVINFAQLTQTDGTFLVSRKPIDHFEWSMLKGSTFLGQRKGGMPQMVGEYVLKQKGINPQTDLTLIQNVDFPNIPNAFLAGTGDFVQLFEPVASAFEQEGKGYIVASFGTESGKVPYTSFMAKDSYITKNQAVIEAFTAAIYAAQQWTDSHTAAEIADVVAPQFKDVTKETMIKVIDRYQSQHSFATNPILDAEEWNNLSAIMKEAGVINDTPPYETLVATHFANEAVDGK
ncbi:MAG: ABC transporter substrate-binding protein [Bacilli bacterium]